MPDWNKGVVEKFRAQAGYVEGWSDKGHPLLLLHHTGAKSGTERVSPLTYQAVDGGYAVFASKGGADDNPDWLYNVVANPETKIEIGDRVEAVIARVAEGEERHAIWEQQKIDWDVFAAYEAKTKRDHIPVVVLEPI